jgi:hypothetical protein
MKNFCGAANPRIDKAIRLLKQYKNAMKSTAKPPYKKSENQVRDAQFKQMKQLLNAGSITLEVYINSIVDLYKFEPRKKYVEKLFDTDESDATSDEDDDSDDDSDTNKSDIESNDTLVDENQPIIPAIEPTSSLIRIGKSNRNFVVQNDNYVDENGKIICDICGKRFTKRGMNIH